jgi:hypothetical protein
MKKARGKKGSSITNAYLILDSLILESVPKVNCRTCFLLSQQIPQLWLFKAEVITYLCLGHLDLSRQNKTRHKDKYMETATRQKK